MTKHGYVVGLDDVILQIADDKLLEFVQAVVSAHKACHKKLGESLSLAAWVGGVGGEGWIVGCWWVLTVAIGWSVLVVVLCSIAGAQKQCV